MKKYLYAVGQKILPYKLNRQPEPELSINREDIIQGNLKDGTEGSLSIVYEIILDILNQFVPEQGKALDIGVGTGVLLKKIANLRPGINFIGIDLSEQMLKIASQTTENNPNITLLHGDMTKLQTLFDHNKFDLITWNLGLHHCIDENMAADVIKEAVKLLKPEGRFFIFDIERPKTYNMAKWFADKYNRGWGQAYYTDSFNSYLAAFSYNEIEHILQLASIGSYIHFSPIVANIFQYVIISQQPISIKKFKKSRQLPNFPHKWQLPDYLFLKRLYLPYA